MNTVKAIPVHKIGRKFNGLHLIQRKEFVEKISNRGTVERLVNKRLLTPYYENGQPKKPIDGRYDNKACYFDFNEYKNIDFSQL